MTKQDRAPHGSGADLPAEDGPRLFRLRLLTVALVILGVVTFATFVTALLVEIHAGTTAYLTGEGHWSRARQDATHALGDYLASGDPADLARARAALDVPLGDRSARLALERSPPDPAAAAEGFRRGRNAEQDIQRMIWMHRWFARAPYFSEAIEIWRNAETPILALEAIAIDLAQAGSPAAAARLAPDRDFAAEIGAIDAMLAPMERRFSDTLLEGARVLRTALLFGSGAFYLIICAAVVGAYAAAMRRSRLTEAHFRAAFTQSTVGMVKLTPEGRVIAANEEISAMLGRPRHEIEGRPFDSFVLPRADDDADALSWARLEKPIERQMLRADGSLLWCRLNASIVSNERQPQARVFVIVEDISEARSLGESLAHQASHDDLTGLINRREIERRIKLLLSAAVASPGVRHTLCFLDLDQFKLVNDTAGHMAGDHLLRMLASILPRHLRPGDWAGRLGGDEFALLLADTPIDAGFQRAQKLNRLLAETSLLWEGRHFGLTASIGLVEIDAHTPSVGWLLRAADTACHLAKDAGRNRVRIYVESDFEVTRRHGELNWASQVRATIAEGRLRLFAQRIVSLQEGDDSLQYEVLIRVLDARGNLCHPASLLVAAERYSQAVALDARVLEMTLELLAQHPEHVQQLELCHINVSGQSAASSDFRATVEQLLDRSPVAATKLCFELTETAAIGRLSDAHDFIEAMRSRGCRIALDDFGSGLSSFAYLKHLPVDILKIDGIFVRELDSDPLDLAVVRAVTDVARVLGKKTIAEWVERPEVLQRLRELGVDAAQGYVMHEPEPLEALIADSGAFRPRSALPRTATRMRVD